MARRDEDFDDDDMPWLAEVEEERTASTSMSQRKLFGGIALFAALLALIVGGIWAITSGQRQDGSSGEVAVNAEDVPLIPADPGPYKVRPTDPGGMQIDGAGDTMYAAGEGEDVGGALDPGALPEDPMPRPGTAEPADLLPPTDGASAQAPIPPARGVTPPAAGTTAPVAIPPVRTAPPITAPVAKPAPLKPLPKPVAPVPGVPVVKATGGSAALQLGAFSSSAAADTAWKDLTKRFGYLGGLGKSVGKVERDGRTLYRLRATGVTDASTATDLCARLRVAGEDCIVAQ